MYKVLIVLIITLGMFLRYDSHLNKHPDNDEIYQLQQITKDLRFNRIFDNSQSYGDHTSFPGEMLFYYYPLKLLNKDIKVDMQRQSVDGLERKDFLILAIPKILITLLGFILLTKLLNNNWVGMLVYTLNPHLIYHAFEMRPYSVLPELAILNIFLCIRYFEKQTFWGFILYASVIYFTCLYHAYGILIVGLPILYFSLKEGINWDVLGTFGISSITWIYFALHNTLGWTPNQMQQVVNPFQYVSGDLSTYIFSSLTGGIFIFALAPLLIWSLYKKKDLLFFSVLVVIPIVLICLVDIKTDYWIHPRQWIWVTPFLIIYLCRQMEDKCSAK